MNPFPRRLGASAVMVAALLAGCGGGDKPSSPAADRPAAGAQAPASSADQAVKDTILNWTFKGGCDFMTDKFIQQQAFVGDTRAARCAYIAKTFQKPRYSPDALKFRSVRVNGAKATVVVGSDIANVETTYTLLLAGGRWRIDDAG